VDVENKILVRLKGQSYNVLRYVQQLTKHDVCLYMFV